MNRLAKLVSLAAVAMAATSALATTVVGTWNGRFVAKFSAPAGGTMKPEQVKQVNSLLAQITITLTMRSNGSYTAVTRGPKQPDATTNGHWKLKGSVVTLAPAEKRPPETGTVSADGHTLTMSLPQGMSSSGVRGKAVFKRA